jgi:hypothetical protein
LAISEQDVVAMARRLGAQDVTRASFCAGGGNNRVYWIETVAGDFALKLYGALATNGRVRLRHEFAGLRLLGECGIANVPRAIASDEDQGCALYEWVDGKRVAAHDVEDIERALAFLQALSRAGAHTGARELPPATEAVLALADLIGQIETRLRRLEAVMSTEPTLAEFIVGEVRPAFDKRVSQLAGWDINAPLRPQQQVLSPSDFGFHNALRRNDDTLCFIDFEYFGWDDPAKLAADFLFHPAMELSPGERQRFVRGVDELYGDDDAFLPRLAATFPLYGIRWTLIILNEFVPERWARRAFSGKGNDWENAKRTQLQTARKTMATVRSYTEGRFIS